MSERSGGFAVSVARDYLTFSAAHFLTIPGHKCERLHGHNYGVTVAIEGELDPATGFVVDFAVVKRILQPVIESLDHRVLIPAANPAVEVRTEPESTTVRYRGLPRFVFPTGHVALVPVPDTTAERLAELLTGAVIAGLATDGAGRLTRVTVDVEETPGQSGRYQARVGGGDR